MSATTLAAVAGIGMLVHRTLQNRRRRPIEARPVSLPPPGTGPRLEDSDIPALEPARVLMPGQITRSYIKGGQLTAVIVMEYLRQEV